MPGDSERFAIYLYESSVSLAQEALALPVSTPTRRDMLKGAIGGLLELVSSGALRPVLMDLDARLILCELLIRHTKSGAAAAEIYGQAFADTTLPANYFLKFKLLEMEQFVYRQKWIEATRIYEECASVLVKGGHRGLADSLELLRMQFSPVSTSVLDKLGTESTLQMNVLSQVLAVASQADGVPVQLPGLDTLGGDEGLKRVVLVHRMSQTLSQNACSDAVDLAKQISSVDWDSTSWSTGTVRTDAGDCSMAVSWFDEDSIKHIVSLYVALVHAGVDDTSELARNSLSEMVRNMDVRPPPRALATVMHFFATLMYHTRNRDTMRDLQLKELQRTVSEAPSTEKQALLDYCNAIIAQSRGEEHKALQLYDKVRQLRSVPSLQLSSIVNTLCIDPSNSEIREALEAAVASDRKSNPDGSELQHTYDLFQVLADGENLEKALYQKKLTSLLQAGNGALQDALAKSLAFDLKGAQRNAQIECATEAVATFAQLGLSRWEGDMNSLLKNHLY